MSHLACEILSNIVQLKKEGSFICVYGAGGLAKRIFDSIKSIGGTIDAFAVDDDHYDQSVDEKTGIEIIKLSDIKKYINYRLIVGFEGDYMNGIKKYDIDPEKVLAADFLGYLATGGQNAFFDEYFKENSDTFKKIREMLSDEKSKKSLDAFIEQKRFGRYDKEYDTISQYFDCEILKDHIGDEEVFVDCGAFQGETALSFIDFLHKMGKNRYFGIYEIEPDADNLSILEEKISGLNEIHVVKAGVSDKKGEMAFDSSNGSSSRISEDGDTIIEVISLDSFFEEEIPVSFIKMDIEGFELMALKGAVQTIKKNRPKLAICVYHKNEDLLLIPEFIMDLRMNYKLYLRNYSRCGVEAVLYAI